MRSHVALDVMLAQLAITGVHPRSELLLSGRAGGLRARSPYDLSPGCWRRVSRELEAGGSVAALRASARCDDRQEDLGLPADQLVPLRTRRAVDGGRARVCRGA